MDRVTISGYLARTAQIRPTSNGNSMLLGTRIANDQGRDRDAMFVDLIRFASASNEAQVAALEALQPHLTKGRYVVASGRLGRPSVYIPDVDAVKGPDDVRVSNVLIVDRFELGPPPRPREADSDETVSDDEDVTEPPL